MTISEVKCESCGGALPRLGELKMQSAKCKVQNAECKMQSAKCKVQNAKCKM